MLLNNHHVDSLSASSIVLICRSRPPRHCEQRRFLKCYVRHDFPSKPQTYQYRECAYLGLLYSVCFIVSSSQKILSPLIFFKNVQFAQAFFSVLCRHGGNKQSAVEADSGLLFITEQELLEHIRFPAASTVQYNTYTVVFPCFI